MVLTRSQRKKQLAKKQNNIESDSENDTECKPQASSRRIRIPHKQRTKPKSKCKTKKKPKSTNTKKKSLKNKRKLSDNSQNVGTPPNKKKKGKSKKGTPSKELAKLMNKVHISNEDKGQKLNFDHEAKEEEPDRDEGIIELQEKLLTQEIDYNLVGRDNEYNKIKKFIELRLKSLRGDSFYICGSPGTGKTATMQSITNYFMSKSVQKRYNLENIIKINGMSLHNPSSIYSVLYKKIYATEKNLKPIDAKNKLEKFFVNANNHKMYIVIIDEMDGLLGNTQQQVLYHLFGWTKQTNCKLILFGIANSIDLTDRFLPRLKQRNFEPELLIFKTYTKEQLVNIMKYRIKGYDYFEDIAINLCATKVAKMYGDIRKCLEICRNALNILLNNKDLQKIGFLEMRQILSSSFESPLIDIIKDLPNHQKTIVVLSTILLNKNINNKKYVIYNKLEQFYQFMSKKYILPKTSSREFNIIIDQLITDNIIQNIDKQKHSNSKSKQRILSNDTKLQIMVPSDDIQFAVQHDDILHKFFEIDINIPKKYMN